MEQTCGGEKRFKNLEYSLWITLNEVVYITGIFNSFNSLTSGNRGTFKIIFLNFDIQ